MFKPWVAIGIISIISFLHQLAFNAGTFYLALYYQVRFQLRPRVQFRNKLMTVFELGCKRLHRPCGRFVHAAVLAGGFNRFCSCRKIHLVHAE